MEADFSEKLVKLKSLLFQFDKPSILQKNSLLNELSSFKKLKTKDFLQLHQAILCAMAYPGSEKLYEVAKNSMILLLKVLE